MRKTRRLTYGERWELGLFLTMVIVGCLCLTALLNLDSLPRLFAFASRSVDKSSSSTVAILPAAAPAATPPTFSTPLPTIALPSTSLAPPLQVEQLPIEIIPAQKHAAPDFKYYAGQKYRFTKTLRLRVTAYAPDSRCCWPYPGTTTASGMSVKTNHGRLVAADTRLIPMHALVSVPGYASGAPVPVLDRGGAIKGHRLDVLMPTFDAATGWGSKVMDVNIYMPVAD